MQQQLDEDIERLKRSPSNVLFSGVLGNAQKRKAKKLCHELRMKSVDEPRFMHGTCLQEQAYFRDEALVDDLLAAGASVNANAGAEFESALFTALYSDEGREDRRGNAIAIKLIEAGADPLHVFSEDGDFGFRWPSLLHMACDGYGAIDSKGNKTTQVFEALCAAGIAADPERFREIMRCGRDDTLLATLYALNIGKDDVRWRRHDGSIPSATDASWERSTTI